MNTTPVTVTLTPEELQYLYWAVSDCRSTWTSSYCAGLRGEKPANFSNEGAKLIMETYSKLSDKFRQIHDENKYV